MRVWMRMKVRKKFHDEPEDLVGFYWARENAH